MYVWPSPSTPRRRRRSPRRVRVSVRPPAQSVGNAAPVPLAVIVRFAHPSLTPLSPARLSSDLLRLEATVAGSLPALEVPTAAPKPPQASPRVAGPRGAWRPSRLLTLATVSLVPTVSPQRTPLTFYSQYSAIVLGPRDSE